MRCLCEAQVQSLARLSWLLTAGTAAQQLTIVLVRRRGLHYVTTIYHGRCIYYRDAVGTLRAFGASPGPSTRRKRAAVVQLPPPFSEVPTSL